MGIGLQISDVLGYKPSPEQAAQANMRSLMEERGRAKDPRAIKVLDEEIARVKSETPGLGNQIMSELGVSDKPVRDMPATAQPAAAPRYTNTPPPVDEDPKTNWGQVVKDMASGPVGVLKAAYTAREPLAEAGKTLASGIWENAKAAPFALWSLAKSGGNADEAAQIMREAGEKVRQPKGEAAKNIVEAVGSPYNPINWVSAAGEKLADVGTEKGVLSPEQGLALRVGSQLVAPGAIYAKMRGAEKFMRPKAEMGSAGASAATTPAGVKAAAESATPELKQSIHKTVDKEGGVNTKAATRQLEADSLPVPIKLTKGEATGDPARISWEQNNRGKHREIGERIAERPEQFHQNIDAIRDEVAPNVYGADHVQNGRTIIDAYKAHDDALRSAISEKYKALENANGGKFPVDGVAFVDAANAALGKALKTDYVPAPIAKQMEKFKAGEPMNFEAFEAMRTNLANDIRSSTDGNVRHAASIVLNALESLPITGEAAALKPLADAARAAAKARFDLLKKDPAYKAVVNGKAVPDDFIQKFVINGKVDNVKTMIENLQPGSVAHETMAAGVLNHLKSNAGANFNQATFNKGLKALSPDGKLLSIIGPKATAQMETLGKVAEYTQQLPRGHYVNTSNTLTGAIAEHAADSAAKMIDVAAKGLPIGTESRKFFKGRAEKKKVQRTLQTGAGISLKEID